MSGPAVGTSLLGAGGCVCDSLYPPPLEVSGVSERLAGTSGEVLKAWRLLLPTMQRSPGAGSRRQKRQELL